MVKRGLFLIWVVLVLMSMGWVLATNCWETAYNTQATCEAAVDCKWHIDPWGSWCEQKGCWNFYDSASCGQSGNASSTTSFINKNCSWHSTQTTGWCMETDCWSLSNTTATESSCESNSYGLTCNWVGTYNTATYDYPCQGPPEKNCWDKQTEATCENTTGCYWGMCESKSCWDYTTAGSATTANTCLNGTGYEGNACKWNSQYNYCYESGCWDYTDQTTCQAANCKWNGGWCSKPGCWDYGYTNETYCESNPYQLNCHWNDPWCEEKSCWSYTTSGTCGGGNSSRGRPCFWQSYSGGWCEEVGCWNWDSYNGGKEADCISNGTAYGLGCVWSNDTYGSGNGSSGWCFQNISSKSCTDLTTERTCLDSYICFWNATNSTCQNPTGALFTEFIAWYPGCYIFDFVGQSACDNVTTCDWVSGDLNNPCRGNTVAVNGTNSSGGIRCSHINNSEMCNKMTMLPHCCDWQAGTCLENNFTTRCWDEMEEAPEGGTYCEDYNAYTDKTICEQISGDPWYMPCKWDNMSTSNEADDRCTFKFDKLFETGKESVIYLDSERSCESAGGVWVMDMYASNSTDPTAAVALPLGHCEANFGGERNCEVECYACDYKSDGTNWSTLQKAQDACFGSSLGICEFDADSSAKNGYGRCKPKMVFRQGIATNCDSDCGSCTYMGNASASEAEKRPSSYCTNSKVTGGCKWIPNIDYPTDESKGRCGPEAEKTCEDKCDICQDETNCVNKGAKKGNVSLAVQCSWDSSLGICKPSSGAGQMEICWDGTDNDNNGKMDCADSKCFTDSFCGGGFMAGTSAFGGKDCFGYTTNGTCAGAGCVWVNETWGSWCDMPGSNCWKKDGDAAACAADGNCSWHSGFGGFCEENWTMTNNCMDLTQEECTAKENRANNCTWAVDTTYGQYTGGAMGWCDPDLVSYTGIWFDLDSDGSSDCIDYDFLGEDQCEVAGTPINGIYPCNWFNSSSSSGGGVYGGGHCEHRKFTCWQFTAESSCTERTNSTYNHSEYCLWNQNEWGGWCEGKMMGGAANTESCWMKSDQTQCTAAGCNWKSGFCDPVGFGNEMGSGGIAGSGAGGMGGFGSNCMAFKGDQTGCAATMGCGWFSETTAFCDVNTNTSCPQYSYSKTVCESKPLCTYNDPMSFCDEKILMCHSNTSYTSLAACQANPLCFWSSWGTCEPICFNASANNVNVCVDGNFNATNGTNKVGANMSACKWVSGWCNPAMATQFFKDMEGGAITPLGADTRGDVPLPEIDIVDFGMKDMGKSLGFGIRVANIENSSMCNGLKFSGNKTGKGINTTKFYWYLDTDGSSSGGCATRDNNSLTGFEFYFKDAWSWSNTSGQATESAEAYQCSSGSWVKAPIPLSSIKQKACLEIGGGMIALEKGELEKFPSLYTTGADIRVYVATANDTGNVTNPTDTLAATNIGYVTPGAMDQDIEKVDLFGFKNASDRVGEAAQGFVEYHEVDCWTATGCADYQCKGHPYCAENGYGVEAAGFTDTRVPKVVGLIEETYPDAAMLSVYTDKPSNMSIELFGPSAGCPTLSVPYIPVYSTNNLTNVEDFTLWHMLELNSDTLAGGVATGATAYYKITFCDNESKCGVSKCSSFKTPDDVDDCAFCKFVTRIIAPSDWNVSYDLDQDGVYEFNHQKYANLNMTNVGMYTNYTTGRRANILLAKDDNTSWMEFLNVTLTKTGLSSATRDISSVSNSLSGTTTTTSAGATIGVVGMIEETRDMIINNLHPEICRLKIYNPDGTCDALWHCDNSLAKCIDRRAEAISVVNGTDYCIWQIPNCEFSIWGGGEPGSPPGGDGGGGGGGAAGAAAGVVCSVGAISCEGELMYKECLASGTKNEWSEIKEVPEGYKCRFGKLGLIEEVAAEEAVAEELIGEAVAPIAEPTEEAEAGEGALARRAWGGMGQALINLSWLLVTVAVVIIGVLVFLYLRSSLRGKEQ